MIRDFINAYRGAYYKWIRSKMKPLTIEEAEERKFFWSKCYLAVTFCALVYVTVTKSKEQKEIMAKPYTNAPKMRVVKFSGLQKVADYEVDTKNIKTDNSQGKPVDVTPVAS